jgi:hypothetical protein
MSTTRNRILSAALLLPVILFSSVWTSFALWRCSSDGIARSQCCCPSKTPGAIAAEEMADSDDGPAVSGTACCALEQYEVDKAPAERGRATTAQVTAWVAMPWVAVPVALLPAAASPSVYFLPASPDPDGPPTGRSVLLRKQSLLI